MCHFGKSFLSTKRPRQLFLFRFSLSDPAAAAAAEAGSGERKNGIASRLVLDFIFFSTLHNFWSFRLALVAARGFATQGPTRIRARAILSLQSFQSRDAIQVVYASKTRDRCSVSFHGPWWYKPQRGSFFFISPREYICPFRGWIDAEDSSLMLLLLLLLLVAKLFCSSYCTLDMHPAFENIFLY